jgi:heme-degrading monooxygenase HmoA
MSYAFTYDVPIDAAIYSRIKDGLGPERPDGLIAHLAWQTDTGLRYVDVWRSKDDFDAFAESRLHPVVHGLMEEMLGFVPPEPEHRVLDLVDVWTDRHPR